MTNEENAAPQQAKRPQVFERPSSPSSPLSSHKSEASSQMLLLVHPTPFDCGQRPPICPAGFNWKLPQHHSQQPPEEKWDRNLGDEIDDDANSSGSRVGDKEVSSPFASFAVSSRNCLLATMNEASRN
ncbi:unnamed protein product [Peronospora effusa]|nr:unnamed protein product [Peronospora effusa]